MVWFGIFFALALTAAVYRASLRATATAFAAALLFYALFGGSFVMFLLLALLWAAVFVPAQMLPLRQEWISRPLLDRVSPFASLQPAVPPGRQAAALVQGVPDWSHALSAPLPQLRAEEQAFLDGPVHDFCGGLPRRAALGAAAVPVAHGGLGFSFHAQRAVIEKIDSTPGRRFSEAAQAVAALYRAAAVIETQAGASSQKQIWLALMARGAWVAVLDESCRAPGDRLGADRAVAQRGLWKGHEQEGFVLEFEKSAAPGVMEASALLVHLHRTDGTALWAWVPTDAPGLAADRRSAQGLFVPHDFVFQAGVQGEAASMPFSAAARASTQAETNALRARLGEAHEARVLADDAADAYEREALRVCADELLLPDVSRSITAVPALHELCRAPLESNPAHALTRFDAALLEYAGTAAQMLARSLLLGLSGGRLLNPPTLGPLRGTHGRISRYSANLGLLLTALPWCGARSQRLEAVLTAIWRRLCGATAMLRVYELQGRREADTPLARFALARAMRCIEQDLDEALHTVPSRTVSVLLRCAVFPLGRGAGVPAPSDEAAVVARLQDPESAPLCPLRFAAPALERLRETVRFQRVCARLESQLDDARLQQPRVLARIHEALGLGLLSPAAAAQLRDLHNRRVEILSGALQQTPTPTVNLIEETDYEK